MAHTFFGLIVIQQDREGNVRMLHYTEVFVTGLTFLRDLNLMLFFLLNCNYYINVSYLVKLYKTLIKIASSLNKRSFLK